MITKETIEKVREALSISKIIGEYTQIKPKGRDNWCCCPHHIEKTPSCKIDETRQLYHCFGCGEGGDIFHFIQLMENMNFIETVRYLAEKAGVEIVEDEKKYNIVSQSRQVRLKQICEEAANFYHNYVNRSRSPMADKCRKYMSRRGFNSDLSKRWNLGFAPGNLQLYKHLVNKGYKLDEMLDANVVIQRNGSKINDRFFNRLMFPISDVSGSVIAFGGRAIDNSEPKYLNSNTNSIFNKDKTLYALNRAKNAITSSGYAIVVEGYTDVIALHEHGMQNAVATLGTALGVKHIRLLSRFAKKGIIYVFDGDEAGQRAIERACSFIDFSMTPEAGILKIELLAIALPEDLDPAEFVEKYGQKKTLELFKTARPLLEFGIDRKISQFDLSLTSERSKAFVESLKILAPIKESVLAQDYAMQIASRCGYKDQMALDRLASLEPPKKYRDFDCEQARVVNKQTNIQHKTILKQVDMKRIINEREFLSLFIKNPIESYDLINLLRQINWVSKLYFDIAIKYIEIVNTWDKKSSLNTANLLYEISITYPEAMKVVTASKIDIQSKKDCILAIKNIFDFLKAQDKKKQIDMLKNKLRDMPSDENASELLKQISVLQKERMSHIV